MTPIEMTTHPEPSKYGNEMLEQPRELQSPYRQIVSETSDEKIASEISTTELPLDSQDRKKQAMQGSGARGEKMEREEIGVYWTKFVVGSVLGLVVGVVLGLRSVSQKACVEA